VIQRLTCCNYLMIFAIVHWLTACQPRNQPSNLRDGAYPRILETVFSFMKSKDVDCYGSTHFLFPPDSSLAFTAIVSQYKEDPDRDINPIVSSWDIDRRQMIVSKSLADLQMFSPTDAAMLPGRMMAMLFRGVLTTASLQDFSILKRVDLKEGVLPELDYHTLLVTKQGRLSFALAANRMKIVNRIQITTVPPYVEQQPIDQVMTIVDMETMKVVSKTSFTDSFVGSLFASADENRMIMVSMDKVSIWDISDLRQPVKIKTFDLNFYNHGHIPNSIDSPAAAFSGGPIIYGAAVTDDLRLLVISSTFNMFFIDTQSGKLIPNGVFPIYFGGYSTAHKAPVYLSWKSQFSPIYGIAATGELTRWSWGESGIKKDYSASTGGGFVMSMHPMLGPLAHVPVAMSPDGKLLVRPNTDSSTAKCPGYSVLKLPK
jgi:hypothetical protein